MSTSRSKLKVDANVVAASALGDSMLRIGDLAKLLGVSLGTVKRWRAEGKLPAADFSLGGVVRWRAATIERWIDRQSEARR